MALTDIYMLTQNQVFEVTGERILNNFFYRRVGAGGSAADLYTAWASADLMQDNWAACQSPDIHTDLTRVINLGSLTDFFDSVARVDGTHTGGENLPLHTAVNFTLRLDTRAVRPGSKRLAGILEGDQNNGVIVDEDYIALLNTLNATLAATLVGEDDSYVPVVVKRVLHAPDEEHDNPRYLLPASTGELVFGNVTAALVNLRVTHQVSRGNGR